MNKNKDLALLVLRVVLGLIFFMHGLDKIFGIAGGSIEGLAGMLSSIGFNPGTLWAWILSVAELLAGLLLIFGIFPKLSASVIAVIMIVAILRVHGPNGFFYKNGGVEFSLLILANSLYFVFVGGGKYSLFDKA